MSLTISPSPFGSLVVSVAETGSTLSVTTVATSPSVLSMALGVPGPTGATGATGATGQGVAAGGTTGQALVKSSNSDYATTWATISSGGGTWGSITGTLSSQTDLQTALDGKLSLTGGTVTNGGYSYEMLDEGFVVTQGSNIVNVGNAGISITGPGEVGIQFADFTTQNTAFPGYTGTSAEYIDGTGALQTFPTVTTAGKMVTNVRNNSGATITKGTVVYINGAVGNKPTIAKAQANSEATSKATFAFVEANIANNADGNVVQIGLLENIDTQGFSDGTQIFLSPTTAGGWTSTQPFSPYHYVRLGTVIRGGHPTQGSISVNIINGFQLDEMSDVGATAPTNNNVLTWVSASSQWLDRSISTILGYTPANGTDYLAKADNLSGLASTSTARTNLGLGAVSTDAYATSAQAQAGTSTTTVVSPSTLLDAKYFSGGKSIIFNAFTSATSGAGAIAGAIAMNAQQVASPTTAVGSGIRYGTLANSSRGLGYTGALDFTKRVTIGGRFQKQTATTDSNAVFRFYCGKTNTVGDLTAGDKAIGFRAAGSGALQLVVSNGSAVTTTTSSFTPVQNQCYDVIVTSDGAGNATLFVNGSSVATSTGAPTTSSGNNFFGIEAQNLAIIATPVAYYMVTDLFVQVNV
jgi:hypothetical protein